MEQYISKSALVKEIKRYKHKADERLKIKGRTLVEDRKDSALQNLCGNLLYFIDTLEVKEVDLKAELNTWRHNHFHGGRDFEASGEYLERITQLELAKHFFEIGLNSQRKISYVPNIDDSLKELGVDPDSKEAKIFKESYYTALEKLKAQKGE